MVLKEFGGRVRQLRLEKGWSQERFALECGLDRTYISGLEKGKRNVSLKNISKICDCLDISLSEYPFGPLKLFFIISLKSFKTFLFVFIKHRSYSDYLS